MKRLHFTLWRTFLLLVLVSTSLIANAQKRGFVHPGLLHTQTDLDRIKVKVAAMEEPWYTDYQKLKTARQTTLDWGARETAVIERGTGSLNNYIPMASAIACAYACAIVWHVEGNVDYANKAVDVLKRWGRTLTTIGGTTDAALARGCYGYQWACVADLMYNYSGWTSAEKDTFKTMLNTVFYPGCKDFLWRHNNTKDHHYRSNWDGFNMAAIIAIGAFEDDQTKFNEIVTYYKEGWYNTDKGRQITPNGVISSMVHTLHEGGLGQCEESGRDQAHCMTAIGLESLVCQIAWNQGVDLYGYDDNRLLKGLEYVAKYNLFNYVPYKSYTFQMSTDGWPYTTNTEHVLGSGSRGCGFPFWDMVYNHYAKIKGLSCPYVQAYAAKMRPDLGGGYLGLVSSGFDFLGYSTLMYTLEKTPSTQDVITFPKVPVLKVGQSAYEPKSTATSGETVRYSSSNPYIVDIVDNMLLPRRAGTVTITALSNGNKDYANAQVTQDVTVTTSDLAFSGKYNIWTTGGRTLDNSASTVEGNLVYFALDIWAAYTSWQGTPDATQQMWYIRPITGNEYQIISYKSGLALSVENSSTDNSARIVQRTYTGTADQMWKITEIADNSGEYKITNKASGKVMSVASNSTANGATAEIRDDSKDITNQCFWLEAVTGGANVKLGDTRTYYDQSVTFNELSSVPSLSGDLSLSATSNKGLPISYFSSNPEIAEVYTFSTTECRVILKQIGTVDITAYQDGKDDESSVIYNRADAVVRTLNIIKNPQTITFEPIESSILRKRGDFEVSAVSSSGLDVYFTSSDDAILSPIGNTVYITSLGTATISARQEGDEFYEPAIPVSQVVNIVETGIETQKQQCISISPNPSTGKFVITLSSLSEEPAIQIFDVLGKKVLSIDSVQTRNSIDMSNYSKGVYTIKVGTVVRKMVIK